jgi:hypothetical protein
LFVFYLKTVTFGYKILKTMQTLQTKTPTKNKSLGKMKSLPTKPQKKSVGELIMQNIPDGKYKGLSALLEPHEIPVEK